MKVVTAVELRQSLGKIAAKLERGGEPVLLVRGKKHVAALISLKDFEERFVDVAAARARQVLVQAMDGLARPAADKMSAEQVLRELRDDD